MCGIAGYTLFHGAPSDPEAVIAAMCERLAPRGPDGSGTHRDAAICLGHQRLSIIDIEGGAQPMHTPDGRFSLVFNGEIYNYIELRAQLEQQGVQFVTRSDTEVLLHQLARHGVDGLRELNGMFAFALWDRDRRSLLLARDRLGIKPLYWARVGRDLVFGSELKALLAFPGLPRRIRELSLSKYLTFGYVPAPHTIFEEVHKLEPGTWMRYGENGDTEPQLYWDLPYADAPISGENLDTCSEHVRELLRDAVTKRLRSDVPVGVFLSGGIDSSAIASLAAEASGRRIHTFSVGFEESSYDESPYARMVAEQYDTEHHHEVLSSRRAVELLPQVMDIMDEPFADASILPTWMLSRFTSQSVKVVLGGDGGDELFAGYPSFQAHRIMERMSFLPPTWRNGLNRLARRFPVSHKYASAEYLLQQFFKGAGVSPEIRFMLWMGYFANDQKQQLLSADVRQRLLRENPFEDVMNYVRQSGLVSDFERLQYLCAKLYMQDDILVKVDRASMAHSLEVRVPFLDHHLVEYAAGIHPAYKLNGLKTKFVLKKAMEGRLPKKIIQRRKAGFMIPLATWLTKDLKDMVDSYCSREALARDGWFDPDVVRGLIDDHQAQRRDYRKLIWNLLAFQVWREKYGG